MVETATIYASLPKEQNEKWGWNTAGVGPTDPWETVQSNEIEYTKNAVGAFFDDMRKNPMLDHRQAWQLFQSKKQGLPFSDVVKSDAFTSRIKPGKEGDYEEMVQQSLDPDTINRRVAELTRQLLEREKRPPFPQERENLKNQAKFEQLIFLGNLRLVVAVAKGLKGLTLEDRISEGMPGLMRAIEKYDPDRTYVDPITGEVKQVRFSTIAVWWIKQAVFRAIQENDPLISMPRKIYDRVMKMRRWQDGFMKDTGEKPTLEDLERGFLGLYPEFEGRPKQTKEFLVFYLQRGWSPDSLNREIFAPVSGDPVELSDIIPDERVTVEADVVQKRYEEGISPLMRNILNPREEAILRLRFGLPIDGYILSHFPAVNNVTGREGENGSYERLTLEEVGELFDVTRERVRQLETRALRRLRPSVKEYLDTGKYSKRIESIVPNYH